jgi:phenylacetate-CoA ligase
VNPEPTDEERYPTLTDAGRALLQRMREHPAAPLFRNRSGNRLLADEVSALRGYERRIATAPIGWVPGQPPAWVRTFVDDVYAGVPYYRRRERPANFQDIETVGRGDLSADIAAFVPDTVGLERMINFQTTGTTGHPLVLPSHPIVAGRYLAFHKRALARFGVQPSHGEGQVGVMLLGFQRKCFTYVSVTPTMDESGLAKINLHPGDWRDPDDRGKYIDAMRPEVIAGDPISFSALLAFSLEHRPRALISVSMALSPALRTALEERFACPVLDIYSMNEAGPLGVYDAGLEGHLLLQPDMYVETVDARGCGVPEGEAGEITLTGGFNFCLPLLRYRTGDHGVLADTPAGPVIRRLHGRKPVRFLTAQGNWINNIDLTHALAALPLSRYAVHQAADGEVTLHLAPRELQWGIEGERRLSFALEGRSVSVRGLESEDKVLQYTTDLEGGLNA